MKEESSNTWWYLAGAAILLVLILVYIFYKKKKVPEPVVVHQNDFEIAMKELCTLNTDDHPKNKQNNPLI